MFSDRSSTLLISINSSRAKALLFYCQEESRTPQARAEGDARCAAGYERKIITGLRVPESAFSPEIRTQMRSLPFSVIVLKNNRDSETQKELLRE